MDLTRAERRHIILQTLDSLRSGVEASYLETSIHEEFCAQGEDFKKGFVMALIMVHDACVGLMDSVRGLEEGETDER